MPCYSPLKGWQDRDTKGLTFRRENGLQEMEVACGQCLGCRLDYSRMWAMRIVHESCLHEYDRGNCFITLTYRSEHECTEEEFKEGYFVPPDWSLKKEHWQLFMKRLRKHFAPHRIRFFAVGEYGSICKHGLDLGIVDCPLCNVGRPHYHAILFNCSFNDLESYGSANGELRYTSPTLERIWKYGNVDVAEANFETAAYCARYSLKKVTGVKADEHYMQFDEYGVVTWVSPEFALMSRKPGIGKDWYDVWKDDIFGKNGVAVPGKGMVHGVPRYYDELFKIDDPLKMEEIKNVRERYRREHAEEFAPERLMDKYKVRKARLELFRKGDR